MTTDGTHDSLSRCRRTSWRSAFCVTPKSTYVLRLLVRVGQAKNSKTPKKEEKTLPAATLARPGVILGLAGSLWCCLVAGAAVTMFTNP
ncbi:uncharacterized protein N7459_004347 [Penicillium hispanicum]|uniref:uncharacterized protein n=1 Tax=Penicillium hispanicum TaxID=1080232 RepID=UPI00253FF446|nr:uncharacterized protein N7459_004347 [Penicillium hispanicum]KAJ5584547.1 hypothetical protein N7459_004347 [Penicillium hispanicum]